MVQPKFLPADLIRVAKDMPAAPRLLVELGQLIRNERVESKEIVALLRQDASLVARLIRIANSVAYARAEAAGSIEEALASIGFREVHRLVGAVVSTQMADQKLSLYGVTGAKLRENALFTAVLMEELAQVAGEDPRTCYTVGLLRSIGKIAIEQLALSDAAVPAFAASGEKELDVWEQKTWGMTNGEAAEHILLQWRLPHETITAIRDHYHPAQRHNPITHLLNLAAGSAEHRCFGLPGEDGFWKFTPENFAKAGLDTRQFLVVTERAQRTFQRLQSAMA